MNLYLVQHAQALTSEEDPERHLSDEGYDTISKVVVFLIPHVPINVETICHSGKARAKQTATILSEHIHAGHGVQETDALEPTADPSVWAERLSNMDDDIMLVGHLPHLSKLASLLLCGDKEKKIVEFRNSGIVCLNRSDTEDWYVKWMVVPEVL